MTVVLPTGWTDFNSGGSDPTLCSTEIPPTITPTSPSLDCEMAVYGLDLEVTGGVPPFQWQASDGTIEPTGIRTATLSIHGLSLTTFGNGNPGCGEAVYVRYGKVKWSTNLPGACDQEGCYVLGYNCLGQIVSGGIVDLVHTCEFDFHDTPPLGSVLEPDTFRDPSSCSIPGGFLCNPFLETPEQGSQCNIVTCGDTSWQSVDGNVTCVTHNETGATGPAHIVAHPADAALCDMRTPFAIARGCAPCEVLQGNDIIVIVTDATGASVAIEIHVN